MNNKKIIFLVFSVILIASYTMSTVQAIRPHYVYDRADILTSAEEKQINNYCETIDKYSTAEIVVVTLNNLDNYGGDINTARNKIFNDELLDGVKGIGQADKDNGVLLVITSTNPPHAGIEVGYGLEGNLTDGLCGRILDNYVMPALRVGNYSGAALDGVEWISLVAINGSEMSQEDDFTEYMPYIIVIAVVVIVILIFMVIGNIDGGGGSGGSYGGGGFGGGGGGFGGGGSGGGGAGRYKKGFTKQELFEQGFFNKMIWVEK